MKQNKIIPLALIALSLPLSGCVGLAVGAGATAGIAAAQEGGIKGAISDASIRAQIDDLWFKYDFDTFAKLHTTITQGRVLITGVVQKPEARVEAVRLVWQVGGVKEVINEIRVADSSGITGYARDTWISARLRAELTFDGNIQAINYSIDTVAGTVYLMGVARNQSELNKVMEIARTIPDVKQVVSYVKMAGEEPPAQRPPARQQGGMLTQPQPDRPYDNSPPTAEPANNTSQGPTPLVPQPVQSQKLNGGY